MGKEHSRRSWAIITSDSNHRLAKPVIVLTFLRMHPRSSQPINTGPDVQAGPVEQHLRDAQPKTLQTWCYASLALIQGTIAIVFAIHASAPRLPWLLTAIVALSLSFDNAVMASGERLVTRNLLSLFSKVRYWLHIVITPFLLPLTMQLAIAGGQTLEKSSIILTWALTLLWSAAGWWIGFRHIELITRHEGSIVFQKNINRSGQPWLDLLYAVLVIIILITACLSPSTTIRQALLTGGLGMLIGESLVKRWGRLCSNLGELVLLGGFAFAVWQVFG
jgi:hypothetical protein